MGKFLAMDTQNKGTVKLDEFGQVLRDNFHVDNVEAEALFGKIDVDNDNEISYNEFLAAVAHDRLRMHEDVLRKTFSRFDTDSAGFFTEGDLRKILGESFEGEDIEILIEEVDADKDGKVTYDEFLSYFQKEDEAEAQADKEEKETVESPVRRKVTSRQTNRERLGKVLDTNFADHSDPSSPNARSGKHMSLRPKTKSGGYVTDSLSFFPVAAQT